MVFCSQVLTELDKFPFFSSFTHYLFLVDSQAAAATDLSSEIQKFVEGHRWSFVVTAIIIGVAVETRIVTVQGGRRTIAKKGHQNLIN
jgi:hypothetical protein